MQVILLFNTIDKIYNLVVILSFVSLVTEWRYLCRAHRAVRLRIVHPRGE